jgi:dihydroxyacetone kinase-like protein
LQTGEPLDGTVGCSVTVSILDEEMKHLWDAPVHTAALRWGM